MGFQPIPELGWGCGGTLSFTISTATEKSLVSSFSTRSFAKLRRGYVVGEA